MGSVGAASVHNLAVFEGVIRLRDINPVRLEALTSAVSIADDHLHASLVSQFPEVLLYGILRETIAYGKHTHNAVLGQGINLGTHINAEAKQEEKAYLLHFFTLL